MEKNSKQRLFEMMEKINPDFSQDEDWAIFKVSSGYGKCFVIALSEIIKGSIKECSYEVKYSDPRVLKFTMEKAKKIVEKNYSFFTTYGIVNSKGVQLKMGQYDKVWGKV